MAKTKPRTPGLGDLIYAHYNPRMISAAALAGLKRSLGKFGDLSGIVWNQRSGHLVAGHQRLRALREEHGDSLRMESGLLTTPGGESFPVRIVGLGREDREGCECRGEQPAHRGNLYR